MGKDIVGDVFGLLGAIISILFFIAPIVPLINLIKEKITYKEFPGILLICSFINCILWVVYGVKLDKTQLYVTNGIGGVVTLIWIFIFLIFFVKKHVLKSIGLVVSTSIIGAGIFLLFYYVVDPKKDKALITGYVAMEFNVLMYAAPVEKIYGVIKTKNYKLIPIFSTIFGFLSSVCWTIYGIYKADINLIVTNGLGLFFIIFQVTVYIIIKYTYGNQNNKKDDKNSPTIKIRENTEYNAPKSSKNEDIEGNKINEVKFESERITVNKC